MSIESVVSPADRAGKKEKQLNCWSPFQFSTGARTSAIFTLLLDDLFCFRTARLQLELDAIAARMIPKSIRMSADYLSASK